jgi:hypothetical protein
MRSGRKLLAVVFYQIIDPGGETGRSFSQPRVKLEIYSTAKDMLGRSKCRTIPRPHPKKNASKEWE